MSEIFREERECGFRERYLKLHNYQWDKSPADRWYMVRAVARAGDLSDWQFRQVVVAIRILFDVKHSRSGFSRDTRKRKSRNLTKTTFCGLCIGFFFAAEDRSYAFGFHHHGGTRHESWHAQAGMAGCI